MNDKLNISAKQLAQLIHGVVEGDQDVVVDYFTKIESDQEGGLSFANDSKHEDYIYTSKAGIIIVNEQFKAKRPLTSTLIRVKNPQIEFIHLLQYYDSIKSVKLGISKQAHIDTSAKIGRNVYIGAGAFVGSDVEIGDDAKIYPQVYLGDKVKVGSDTIIYAGAKIYEDCIIGEGCIIHAGAVVGADGFGFFPNGQGKYEKIPQLGNVVIEDQVEIGANSCIDKATIGSTIIHRGVKIDNLNQIAHNCEIGENSVFAACCGVAGSVVIGSNCVFGGQVGVKDHVRIGTKVVVGSQTGIHKNIADGQQILGSPAMDGKKMMRIFAAMNYLPDLVEKVIRNNK